MIVPSFDVDGRGRPVITLFLAAGAPRIAALEALGEASPAPVEVRAPVDTGASRTTVQKSVLDRLGLDPVGADSLSTASPGKTPKEVDAYAVQPSFAGVPGGRLDPDLRVVEAEDLGGLGVEVLLGRDVLGRCLLSFNGLEGRFTLAFPPPA